jgi:hypothetical protein
MKLLIGSTGLIGTTLKDSITFDYEFNSKNINDLIDLELTDSTDVYLSCLPATKYLVNQNPTADLDNILKIIDILSTKRFNRIILYSTIDVYNGTPLRSNEDVIPKVSNLSYGSNRYMFELLVKNNLKYSKLVILRLPALFGKHIKKNIVYDLLNNNEVNKIQTNSEYQWYNLNALANDSDYYINTSEEFLCVNMFSEPVKTANILKLFPDIKLSVNKTNAVKYNYTSKCFNTYYYKNSNDILSELSDFISEYKLLKLNSKI